MPFDLKLLYDRKFTNVAQAQLRKLLLSAPSTRLTDTFGLEMKEPNMIYNVTSEEQKSLEFCKTGLTVPKRKQRPLTSQADRAKYWKPKPNILD